MITRNTNENKKIALLLLEGNSEENFYKEVVKKYVNRRIHRKYINLNGNGGINKEIASKVYNYLDQNPRHIVYVYAFIDREGTRSKVPEFNPLIIEKELKKYFKPESIKRVEKIEAIQMIESWYLYDIEGICRYIGVKCTKSIISKYANPEKFNVKDLKVLFRKGNKNRYYRKGDKGFILMLNKDVIYNKCTDLKNGIEMINYDFNIKV